MPAPFDRVGDAASRFNLVEQIPGFFNYDDAQHFHVILGMQRARGPRGDLLEIGTWMGRSASFLSFYIMPWERLYLIDVFDSPATDKYPQYPAVEQVRASLVRLNPESANRLVFLAGTSSRVSLPPEVRLRFAHVDGGHSFEECLADLTLVGRLLVKGGVVAVDDYDHPDWPDVKPATDAWLSQNPEYHVLADLNRSRAKGRKLYLIRGAPGQRTTRFRQSPEQDAR